MQNVHYRALYALFVASLILSVENDDAFAVQDDGDKSARQHSVPEPETDLRRFYDERRQQRIAEQWERMEFEKDRGGMIPMSVLMRGRPLGGPLPADPLRRDAFDELCEQLEIWDTVAADTVETIWQMYVDRINDVLLNRYAQAYDLAAAVAETPTPKDHASAALYEEMIEASRAARHEANRSEDHLFRMLATIEPGQFASLIESLHEYRRWERATTIPIEVPGAEIHLSRLLDRIDLDWPNAPIRQAYEMEIAAAAERHLSHRSSVSARIVALHASGYFNRQNERLNPASPEGRRAREEYRRAAQPLRRQRWLRQRAMYAINARYLTLLSFMLDEAGAELLYDTFMYNAFPEYFPNAYDLRNWFDGLLDETSIGGGLRRDIEELRQTYRTVQQGLDDSLIRTIHEHQADFMIMRRIPPDALTAQKRRADYELHRRYENAVVFAGRMVELLEDDERFGWVQEELEEWLEIPLTRR